MKHVAIVAASLWLLAATMTACSDDSADQAKHKAQAGPCQYKTSEEPVFRKVDLPSAEPVEMDKQVHVAIETNQGIISLTLDPAKAPCTVNNFLSLTRQGFYDGSPCHRLTTAATVRVLQCGAPDGGPGYTFGDEYPVGKSSDQGLYKRGTIAMANAGPNTNASQFFLVYGDTQLQPDFTIFGTVDAPGLATLDKIAAGGAEPGDRGPEDGRPKLPVDMGFVKVTS